MDSQTDGLLFRRALKLFSPDIFHHPVWIRFADSLYPHHSDQILQLVHATKQMELQGDCSGACQLLILCALQYSRSGDYSQALDSILVAEKLAEQHNLQQMIIWSAWGACALCIQQGNYQRATDHIKYLQEVLKNSGEWVLFDLVQLIQQYLGMLAEAGGRLILTEGLALPADPLLGTVIHSLLHWGEVQEKPKITLAELKGPEQPENGAQASPTSTHELNSWRVSLQKILGLLPRKPKLSSIENGRGKNAPASRSSNTPLEEGEQLLVTKVEDHPDKQFIPLQGLSKTNMGLPFLQSSNRSGESKFSQARLQPFPSLLLLPADIHGRHQLVIYCLGSFRVYQQDQSVDEWLSHKGLSILKYLSTHLEKPIPKDILMDLFWPRADGEIARRNLHQAVYALRQTLRRRQTDFPYIQFENDCYLLNSELDIWLDFIEFERLVQSGRNLESAGRISEAMEAYGAAEGLYQGDFLEEDLYENWPMEQRMYYRAMYLYLLDRLTEYYLKRHEFTPAIGLCQKMLAKDNCNEQAYRWMIHCYIAQGQRHLAVRAYLSCIQTLRQELDLEPSQEIQAFYRQIVG